MILAKVYEEPLAKICIMAASIAEDRAPKVIKQGYIKKKGEQGHFKNIEKLFILEFKTCFSKSLVFEVRKTSY